VRQVDGVERAAPGGGQAMMVEGAAQSLRAAQAYSEVSGKTNLKLMPFVRIYALIRVVIREYIAEHRTHTEDGPVAPIDAQQQPFCFVIPGRSKSRVLLFILKIKVLWLNIHAYAVWELLEYTKSDPKTVVGVHVRSSILAGKTKNWA
jgi:hypothetical protein